MASAAGATMFAAGPVSGNRMEQKTNENERIHLDAARCAEQSVDLYRSGRAHRARRLSSHRIKSSFIRDGRLRGANQPLAGNDRPTLGSVTRRQRIHDGGEI